MLKQSMFKQHKKIISLILIISLFLLTAAGCGLFGPKESAQIDPPPAIDTMKELDEIIGSGEELGEEITLSSKVLYLLDPNGLVVPVTMKVPYVESIAQQVLRYMVAGGPVEEMLPSGFTAPLPEGTTFTMDIDNGLATVDFSNHFKNYEAAEEQAIIDAITWALTEFSTIQSVKLSINGVELEKMPVANTPVDRPLTRSNGINLEMGAGAMPGRTSAVTIYFEGEDLSGELQYFVPITRLVPMTNDLAKAALEELIKGPKVGSGLVYSLLPNTQIRQTYIENDTAVADFDDMIRGVGGIDLTGHSTTRGLQSIVLSLAATHGVSKVQIMVNGKAELMTETIDFTQPVSVPKLINPITS